MPNTETNENSFSPEAFFVAVVRSEAIKQIPQAQQENFRWFLFNAPEETQKQFFDILKKEEAINQQHEEAKLNFAQTLLKEYEQESSIQSKKFDGDMRRKTEDDEQRRDLNKSENLISNL